VPGRECATLKSFLRADTEESDATLHQWRISGSDQLGAHIGKRFMGKMYLGQVVAWSPAGTVPEDLGKDWFMVLPSSPCPCTCSLCLS